MSTSNLCQRCCGIFSTPDALQRLHSKEGYEHYTEDEFLLSQETGCEFCAALAKVPLFGVFGHVRDPTLPVKVSAWNYDEFGDYEYGKMFDEDGEMRDMVEAGDAAAFQLSGNAALHHSEPGEPAWKSAHSTNMALTAVHSPVSGPTTSARPDYGSRNGKLDSISFQGNGIKWKVFAEPDNLAADYVEGRPMVLDVNSEVATLQAASWLQECEENHVECPGSELPMLPTRVINVGRDDRNPRLHISETSERAKYVALSYCWGGSQEYKTTQSTILSKSHEMPIDNFPQTIKDAIQVTRALGIEYLWVDALCIIQAEDEEEGVSDDKMKELQQMGAIYRQSTVTIAAGSASRVADGFLQIRPEPSKIWFPFYTPRGQGKIYLILHERHKAIESILDTRAWCFQEAVLPPRRLIYAASEMLWSCRRHKVLPVVKSHLHYERQLKLQRPSTYDGILDVWDPEMTVDRIEKTNSLRLFWAQFIRDYVQRDMTHITDRPLAVQGIAQVLADLWSDEYAFGVFKKQIGYQLQWHSRGPWDGRNCSVVGHPSWSWLSDTRSEVVPIALTAVQTRFDECTSDFRKGRLHLRVWMVAVASAVAGGGAHAYIFKLDDQGETTWCGDDDVWDGDARAQLLLVGWRDPRTCIGIVVIPVDEGTFRRIGHFTEMCLPLPGQTGSDWSEARYIENEQVMGRIEGCKIDHVDIVLV